MLNLKQYKENPDCLSDLLPFAALVSNSVVLNKDGSFLSTFKYRGPDLDSETDGSLIAISARINNILKRLGSGYAIYVESKRDEVKFYPKSYFPDYISYLIDEERRAEFMSGDNFESSYYLTLVYLPPKEIYNKVTNKFIESKEEVGARSYQLILNNFQIEIERILGLLAGVFHEVDILKEYELLTYLHSTVSSKDHKVRVPDNPVYLDSILSDSDLLTGFEPKLGNKFIKVVSIRAYPTASYPAILDKLNHLSIKYRFVTRFISLNKLEAETELRRYKKKWFAKRKGVLTLLKETITGETSVMEDSDAVNKAIDAESALEELQDDQVRYGYFTAVVVLMDESLEVASQSAKEVERVINSLGFSTKIEQVNAVDAFLGSIPGNTRNNVRRPIVNTLNLSHLMPVSSVFAGELTNQHLKAEPLFFAKTSGSTQFRFSPHVGDVGHTLVLGPTGAGKSVLLNLMEVQFLRYENAQVYIFDKGGSARTLTYGVGGDYYDLGSEKSALSFQPLARINEDRELRFAHDWILDIFIQENIKINPVIKDNLWIALKSLSTAPKSERTIFGLTVLLQEEQLRKALLPYTITGAYGNILDREADNLSYGFWQCFEMEILMDTPRIIMPVLSYLFHRLKERFKGQPTLLVLDEAWIFLDNPAFQSKIREWLKVLRKSNVAVVFATQSLADIDESEISQTIKEACLTKIYLPNSVALNYEVSAIYKKFGLNDQQIRILATSIPKKEYYYTSPLGNRIFELGLGEIALTYLAGTSKEKQNLVNEIKEKSIETLGFNIEYLKSQGLGEVSEYLSKHKNEVVF